MMLDRGVFLSPERKSIFINMNYYGLALHYNFRTGLINFTPKIEVAAFFANTVNKGGAVLSQKIFEAIKGGKALLPDDSLAKYAKRIIDIREVTGQTFSLNLYSNQDSTDDNLSILAKHHIEVNWHNVLHFYYDILKELEQDFKKAL